MLLNQAAYATSIFRHMGQVAPRGSMWVKMNTTFRHNTQHSDTIFSFLIVFECGRLLRNVLFFFNHIEPRGEDLIFHIPPHSVTCRHVAVKFQMKLFHSILINILFYFNNFQIKIFSTFLIKKFGY